MASEPDLAGRPPAGHSPDRLESDASGEAWVEVTGGLRFPEAPVAMADGSVLVTEIAAGRITRIRPDGAKERVATTGGGPNGLAIGPDGALYVCNNGGFNWVEIDGLTVPHGEADDYRTGSIQRVDLVSGRVDTLYESGIDAAGNSVALRGPNDIVFDRDGGFWFTDHGKIRARERDVTGVFYARTDGSACREVIFPLDSPNGVGLSPDGGTLYVAETYSCTLWAFDIAAPGEISPHPGLIGSGGRFVHSPPGFRYFDSLAVEADGRVCVATIGEAGFTIVAPDGTAEFIATDDPLTTNLAFGGQDGRTAFATLSGTGRLMRRQWPRPGLKLNFNG